MRIVFLASFLIGLLYLGTAPKVWALDVPVRTGSHKDYSRLVFDWPEATAYTAQRSDDGKTLRLEFKAEAGIEGSALAQTPVSNITALSISGEKPLKLDLSIPKSSRIRDFTVGNKVIIDIYNPTDSEVLEEKPLSIAKITAAPPEEKEPKAEPKTKIELKPEDTLESKSEPESKPEEAPPPIKIKGKTTPTLVTMSSTKGFALAAFEKDGRVWIVTDRDDPLMTPHLSGPQTQEIQPFEVKPSESGKAYAGTMPPNMRLKGQGGGILWRLMISPDLALKAPISPVRREVKPRMERGGKLMWPLKSAKKIIKLQDEVTGENIHVVLVEESADFSGLPQDFIDFYVLNSPIGLAIVPKSDDITLKIIRGGVEISKNKGLALSEENKAKRARNAAAERAYDLDAQPAVADNKTTQTIFDFKGWRMGGLRALQENRTIILGRLKDLEPAARAENLITLGKAYLANMMGPESLGILHFAEQELPDIAQNAEFKALTGAAKALSGKSEEAFADLSTKDLQAFPDIGVWRAYALADLGDWQQAIALLPENAPDIIQEYPPAMKYKLALTTAEIYLRSGDLHRAESLLHMVEKVSKRLPPPLKAALTYLKGEKSRQKGDIEETTQLWKSLLKGGDPLYRAKSGLALTRLLMDQKKVTPRRAIDKLEQLRYAWRGDDIEAQINYWLGLLYFQDGQYVKGLNIMRDATTYTSSPALSQRIANDMGNTFVSLFTDSNIKNVSALDAVTLYEQFSELVPPNEQGDKVIEGLAEHLVKADLLARAGDLLSHQVHHRLNGYEAYRIAVRLAVIRLIDERPDDAMAAVNLADMKLKELPEELQTEKNWHNVALLRARTLSYQGRPDQALSMLQDMEMTPKINRLRADIAWRASYWDDAAEALGDVILDQNISLTRPLSTENTALLLQRAVALNLASDRIALVNMREKYAESMSQTGKAKIFEIISRPRQSITLSDRETLLSVISEVDLFSNILSGMTEEKREE